MRRPFPILTTACTLLFVLGSSSARAAEPPAEEASSEGDGDDEQGPSEEFQAKVAEAGAAFDEGDYDRSATLLQEAYGMEPDPNLLYNIARVYEEAANTEAAVEYYTRFVESPEVSLELKGKAVERLDILKKILEATKEPEPTVESESEPASGSEPEPEPGPEPKPHRPLRIAGYTMLGVGLAAVGGGVTSGVLASTDSSDLEAEADPGARQELIDSGETKALVADVLIFSGAALATTGLVLAIVGESRRKKAGEGRVAFTPVLTSRQVGASFRARF